MSTKKRKVGFASNGNNDNDTNNDSLTPPTPTIHRTLKKGKRTSTIGNQENSEFLRQKQILKQHALQRVNAALLDGLLHGKLQPAAPQSDTPNFRRSSVAEYRRTVVSVLDAYGKPTGDVVSMGQDDCGQLGLVSNVGLEEKELVYPPTLVKDLRGSVIQVSAGGMHSAALKADGNPYTWGCSDDGALARFPESGDEVRAEWSVTAPTTVTGFKPSQHAVAKPITRQETEDGQIIAIATGASHTAFLSINGNVYTSGMYKDADSGKFSDVQPPDDLTNYETMPKRGSPCDARMLPVHAYWVPQKVRALAAGGSMNAAILQDSTLVTWGMGHCGELARSADMTKTKCKKPDESYTEDVGPQFYKNMDDGSFLEDVVKEHFLTPKPPLWNPPLPLRQQRHVTAVACGAMHLVVAARAPNEAVSHMYSAGLCAFGQLGLGHRQQVHELTLVEALKHEPISKVTCGIFHTLVLNDVGDKVFACGRTDYGQSGLYDSARKSGAFVTVPTRVKFPEKSWTVNPTNGNDVTTTERLHRFVDIDAGDNFSFAWTSTGTCYSWGYNEYGTTGHTYVSHDIQRPQRKAHWLKDGSVYCRVHQVSGGGQHGLLVLSRYNNSNNNS